MTLNPNDKFIVVEALQVAIEATRHQISALPVRPSRLMGESDSFYDLSDSMGLMLHQTIRRYEGVLARIEANDT